MTFVHQIEAHFDFNGEVGFNIFHVDDIGETNNFALIASTFRSTWWDAIKVLLHDTTTLLRIVVRTLDAAAAVAEYILLVNETGDDTTGDPYASGVHVHVALDSADAGERGGGKLVGGFGEAQVNGNTPSLGLGGQIGFAFFDLISGMVGVGNPLSIYRPSDSLPGSPVSSLVSGYSVKPVVGTNNRRSPDYD